MTPNVPPPPDPRPLLDDLAARIDPAVEAALAARWHAFLDGRPATAGLDADGAFRPRRPRPSPPRAAWPAVPVNWAVADPGWMLAGQLAGVSGELAGGGGRALAMRANHGVGILPSTLGCAVRTMDPALDLLPTSLPLPGGLADARALLDRSYDPAAGLGAATLDMGRRFAAALAPYPELRRFVHVYHPDLQGPLDVLELVVGGDMFTAFYDEPGLVHALLARIAHAYAAFTTAWRGTAPVYHDPARRRSVHWGWWIPGALMLRDDSAMNLSPAMYAEFAAPYNERLFAALGGGALHACGKLDHWVGGLAAQPACAALHMSQSRLNDLGAVFAATVGRGRFLLGLDDDGIRAARAAGLDFAGRVLAE